MRSGLWAGIMTLAVGTACGGGEQPAQGAMAGDTTMQAEAAMPVVQPATYTVIVKSRWTRENHPFEYPSAGALSGPHFSGVIGASHDTSYTLFAEGRAPTPGLENLSEQGKHGPLDDEIRAAITAGSAGALFESGPLRNFTDSIVTTVSVDAAHPLVSLVAMVAPSPDWFTGVAAVNLLENGAWVGERTLELRAWDSGGDDGTTYKAADRDTDPKRPTSQAATPHFVVNGAAVPVGSVTFIRN